MLLRRAPAWPAVLVLSLTLAACETDMGSSRQGEPASPAPTTTTSEPGIRPSESPSTTAPARVDASIPRPGSPWVTQPPTAPFTRASTVYGFVTAGPTCPVERLDQPCPPRPVKTTIQARSIGGGTSGSATSGDNGRYEMTLPPGRYKLYAQSESMFPQCQPIEVEVTPNSVTRGDISCDTGIRN